MTTEHEKRETERRRLIAANAEVGTMLTLLLVKCVTLVAEWRVRAEQGGETALGKCADELDAAIKGMTED